MFHGCTILKSLALPVVFSLIASGLGGCAASDLGGAPTSGAGGSSSSSSTGALETPKGSVVIGLTSELRAGLDISHIRVVLRANGEVIADHDNPPQFPGELPFLDLPEGTPIEAELVAFTGEDPKPYVERRVATTIVADTSLLLRVNLERSCVERAGGGLPGAPQCDAPETCVAGACSDSNVDSSTLPAYTKDWVDDLPSACKPVGAGDPQVSIGLGTEVFQSAPDLAVAPIEAGNQGGHHIWLAVETKNLREFGTLTTIEAYAPEIGVKVPPYSVYSPYVPDSSQACELAGLRLQLDQETDIAPFFGKVLNVMITVTDKDGAVGVANKSFTLSKTTM